MHLFAQALTLCFLDETAIHIYVKEMKLEIKEALCIKVFDIVVNTAEDQKNFRVGDFLQKWAQEFSKYLLVDVMLA